ncbi:hypothetical protein [Nocardia carnea]|uniref:hypothetical protein n=1 Tax=Nocardia carnea TaxID=37328 RepID=UPI002459111F|nr:hypothetical protein [Nocardia carnea]
MAPQALPHTVALGAVMRKSAFVSGRGGDNPRQPCGYPAVRYLGSRADRARTAAPDG